MAYKTNEEYQTLEAIRNWGINQNKQTRDKIRNYDNSDSLDLGIDWLN